MKDKIVERAKAYVPCYETHPPLMLGGRKIYGGSCSYPIVTDADIYVGLDHTMKLTKRSFPWNRGTEFEFYIQDHNVPTDVFEFRKMIEWLCNQLQGNRKIHVGCIGGHGRTGLVLAAITAEFLGEKDAINYVRKHYCKKAVEAKCQVDFLVREYGVISAKESDTYKWKNEKTEVKYNSADWDREWTSGYNNGATSIVTPVGQKSLGYEKSGYKRPIEVTIKPTNQDDMWTKKK